jgi:hypothetical protein
MIENAKLPPGMLEPKTEVSPASFWSPGVNGHLDGLGGQFRGITGISTSQVAVTRDRQLRVMTRLSAIMAGLGVRMTRMVAVWPIAV